MSVELLGSRIVSRSEPTKEERAASKALLEYLKSRGLIITEKKLRDKPDLRFKVGGVAAGCEIVSLVPSEVQQTIRAYTNWLYKKNEKISKIIIPIEPHAWMKKVIEDKWAKVQKYTTSEYTNNLSLLVHYPMLGHKDPTEYDKREYLDGVAYGERMSSHGFLNIFYWSGKSVYQISEDKDQIPTVDFKLENGYPAYVQVIAKGTQAELRDVFEEGLWLDVSDENTKIVKPLDTEFSKRKPRGMPEKLKVVFGFKESD